MASLLTELENELLLFTLKLYNNPIIPRKAVQIFIEMLYDFINNTYAKYIPKQLEIKLISYNPSIVTDLNQIFTSCNQNKQLILKTELEYSIDIECKLKALDDQMVKELVPVHGCYIPLKHSLKLILEIPGFFKEMINYMNSVKKETSIISNYLQGDMWKKMSADFGEIMCVPLFVFQDDCECGNALGSHAGVNKLDAIYVSSPCWPISVASKLGYIIPNTYFYAEDRIKHGNLNVFIKLINELNSLRNESLQIQVYGNYYQIYFRLVHILGDNLGQNSILGFTENCMHGKPCRIYTSNMSQIASLIQEDPVLLRSKDSYKVDCELNDSSLSSINEECVFNKVQGFFVCYNSCLDLMHDSFEGTANYTLVNILNDLIYKENLFTLEFLNNRIKTVDYGTFASLNKIPPLKREHIQNKQKLKVSASEMMNLCNLFGLLVGNKVPKGNKAWQLYYYLRSIVDIVLSPRYVKGHLLKLEHLITDFLRLYIEMYGDLKYKFHNMLHIPRMMKRNGPLIQ
ncbi:uncharacterized protein [Prorops nasuta]|uniref:uncharacterized protein n=1 Tax=Prorops nasuta TaxID=863751 RepID=UPI0034CE7847